MYQQLTRLIRIAIIVLGVVSCAAAMPVTLRQPTVVLTGATLGNG